METMPRYLIMSFPTADAAQRAVNEKVEEGYFLSNTFRTGDFTIVVVMELENW